MSYGMFRVPVADTPPRAAHGGHGWCPACDCGGQERPCWNCGWEGVFYATTGHMLVAR